MPEVDVKRMRWCRRLAFVQGLYFIVTGLSPWVVPGLFAAVTEVDGPLWAFRAIGLFIFITGLVILDAARRNDFGPAVVRIGVLTGMALAIIDLDLMRLGVIGRINACDVLLQCGFATGWVLTRPRS